MTAPLPDSQAAPVCPRHPDRVSYVRCQRCERPMCVECQRPAPVGIQCVDCVAEQAARRRPVVTPFGARVGSKVPVVTYAFMGLAIASFVLQYAIGDSWEMALMFFPVLGESEPWRFLTSAFLHSRGGGLPLHILFNMYALWIVGPHLELALGRARYLALLVLSAVGGSVMVTLLADPASSAWYTGVLGASGAVFGLFGAMLLVLRRLNLNAGPILSVLAINLVLGFVVSGISWQAHLGGLVVGLALGAAYAWAPKPRQALVAWVAPAATAVLMVAVTAAKFAAL